MEVSNWDAACFIAKKNVKFHGYGIYSNYEKMDMKLKIKWYIDDEKSEEYDIELPDAEKDPENYWHEVYLKDFGCKPISVSEG